MDIDKMTSENTPKRWRVVGKHLVDNDPAQLDKLEANYKAVLEKAATFTSPAELGIGNQPGVGSEPDPILVTGLEITLQGGAEVAEAYDMAVQLNLNFAVEVTPTNASNKEVVFTSSDPSVARITSTYGLVELLSVGEVEITATAKDGSGVTDSVIFDVVDNR